MGGGGTLNVEVIGMVVGNVLENPKNTQILILNCPNCNFQGYFETCFGKNGFHFPKIFQKTLKIPKSEFHTLKYTTNIPITLL